MSVFLPFLTQLEKGQNNFVTAKFKCYGDLPWGTSILEKIRYLLQSIATDSGLEILYYGSNDLSLV